MERDIDDAMSHVDLVVDDLGDPRRRFATWTSGTGTANGADAADQEDDS
jgi:hypothetical protein